MDNVKKIMATQLTETEIMVFLLVRSKKTYREIEDLPFGFTRETARTAYASAADKIQKMVAAGILDPSLGEGNERH